MIFNNCTRFELESRFNLECRFYYFLHGSRKGERFSSFFEPCLLSLKLSLFQRLYRHFYTVPNYNKHTFTERYWKDIEKPIAERWVSPASFLRNRSTWHRIESESKKFLTRMRQKRSRCICRWGLWSELPRLGSLQPKRLIINGNPTEKRLCQKS